MSDGITDMAYEEQLIKPQQATLLRRSLEIDDDTMAEHTTDELNAIYDDSVTAEGLLDEAISCLAERAKSRDVEKERSMKRAVACFNSLTGKNLSERDGWVFMVILKLSRAQVGVRRDDYVDGAAYMALAGESVLGDN